MNGYFRTIGKVKRAANCFKYLKLPESCRVIFAMYLLLFSFEGGKTKLSSSTMKQKIDCLLLVDHHLI